jgi:hypothetical protein
MTVRIVSDTDIKQKEAAVAKAILALDKLIALRRLEVKVAEDKASARDKKKYAAMRRTAWKQAESAYEWVAQTLGFGKKKKRKAVKKAKKIS